MKKLKVGLTETPSPEERKAASELKKHLGPAGGEGSISLLRSPSYGKDVLAESYSIESDGKSIKICCDGAPGALYGAYEYIEKCGARWLFEQPEGFRSPGTGLAKGKWSSGPDFRVRYVGGRDTEGGSSEGSWAVWNKTNGVPDLACGGRSAAVRTSKSIAHNFKEYLNPRIYFDEHPDWFPLIEGERRPCSSHARPDAVENSYGNQICTTNEEAIAEFANNIRLKLEKHPEVRYVPIGPNDGYGFCECPGCLAADSGDDDWERSLSARLMKFWNRVAGGLRGEFPEVVFMVPAYINFTLPPLKSPGLGLEPNIAVLVTHYQHCMLHASADPDCPPNRRFCRALREWSERSGSVFVYEYYNKVAWFDGIWPVYRNIVKDIPFYHSLGIRGFYTQYSPHNSFTNGLNYWLAARMTWDVDADGSALIDEWIERCYGKAADPMADIYAEFAKRFNVCGEHFSGGGINMSRAFDEELFKWAAKRLEAAGRLAETGAELWCVESFARLLAHTGRLREYSAAYLRYMDGRDAGNRKAALEKLEAVASPILKNSSAYRGIMDEKMQFAEGVYLDGQRRRLCGLSNVDPGNLHRLKE